MKAIVTVVGKDQVGIIANVCAVLAQYKVNILDISQTIMQGYFTMMMVVDTENCEGTFVQLAKALEEKGEQLKVSIRLQREDIFDAMHRV